jgi:hypothetical protein
VSQAETAAPDRAWRWALGVFALAALTLFAVSRLHGFVADDAFILYRYANNFAAGCGWTYNAGTTTANAATSTLYTLMLAGAALVTGRIPDVGTALTVAGLTGAGVATCATLRRMGNRIAGVAAAVWIATSPWLLSTRGMETPVYIALVSVAPWAVVAERPAVLGVALGLAFLTRPDAIVLALPVLAWWWARGRRSPVVPAVILGGMVVAWAIFGWVTVGSPVSNTLAGKIAQARSGFFGEGPLFLRGFVDMPDRFGFRAWSAITLALACIGLAVGIARSAYRGLSATLAGFASLHAFAYGVVLRPPAYHWYYGVEVYAAIVFAAMGCGFLVPLLPSTRPWRSARHVAAGIVVGGIALLGLATSPSGYRYRIYDAVSDWLVENTDPHDTVAATEIGVIGYRSGRPIVDYLGLVDADSVPEVRRGDLSSWLARTRPDYWVVHSRPWPFELPALATPEFRDHYEVAVESDTFTIYRRR